MSVVIPADKITEVKQLADIADVVSGTVMLKRKGKNLVGLCPFHAEKTPSFTVSPDKQIFHCFGCGAGGDVIEFIRKQNGFTFVEAVKYLAKQYGVSLPVRKLSDKQKAHLKAVESVFRINDVAAAYFNQNLYRRPKGDNVRDYLHHRGISDKTIEKFKLGYALGGWDQLLTYLQGKHFSPRAIAEAGLIVPRKNRDGFYDRFRDRVIFPIFDSTMQIIGFGGRVLDDGLPKYLNSPETVVFNKSRALYGLPQARAKSRETGRIFIVEGYFDLLTLHQHDIENVVATLGTSMTSLHGRLIKGFTKQAILVFDADSAGINAAKRTIPIFSREHIDARIMVLPQGDDPDAFIRRHGPEAFNRLSQEALEAVPFLIEQAIKTHGLSIAGKSRIVEEMQGVLAGLTDFVTRSLYIRSLCDKIGVDENAMLDKVRRFQKRHAKRSPSPYANSSNQGGPQVPEGSKAAVEVESAKLERQVIAMLLNCPECHATVASHNIIDDFQDRHLRSIGKIILNEKVTDVAQLIRLIDDEQRSGILMSLIIKDELWTQDACMRLVTQCKRVAERRKHSLIHEINSAENDDDDERLIKLMQDKQAEALRRQKRLQ